MIKLLKNIFRLVSGTAGGQVISILLLPILTRKVSPELMGHYSVFLALIIVLNCLAGMRLDLAVMTSNDRETNLKLLRVSNLVNLGICALFFIICILIKYIFHDYFVYTLVQLLIACAGLYFFTYAQFLSCYYISEGSFQKSSINRFLKPGLAIFFQILLIQVNVSLDNLLLGYVLGYSLPCLVFDRKLQLDIFFKNKKSDFLFIWSEFRNYFLFQAPAGLVNAVSQNIANFVLITLVGSYYLGLYSLAFRMIQAPITLVSGSVRDAYFHHAKGIYNESPKKLPADMMRSVTILFLLSSCISATLYTFLPGMFSFFFGQEWHESGTVASYLLPWFIFLFCNPPATVVANIIGCQLFILIYEILNLIIRVLVLLLSWYITKDFTFLILAFSFAGVVMNVFYITSIYFLSRKKVQ
ncbi:hypothetical protein C7M52_00935 [Mixta theicola]|nr:oligosaccharide flippase family protein [Mixta theicola]QHM74991.1 hypothetical protein C7M52_00935 [Mixta theicola]